MSDPKLKPCPFCGGLATFEEIEPKSYPGHVTWSVGCGNEDEDCIATQVISTYSRKIEAADAWNKRAPVHLQIEGEVNP